MQPIPQDLIIRALALTRKTMADFQDIDIDFLSSEDFDNAGFNDWWDYPTIFSYPKFFYFLLSPEFVQEYPGDVNEYMSDIPHAIYEYQSGNSAPIISLLTKI